MACGSVGFLGVSPLQTQDTLSFKGLTSAKIDDAGLLVLSWDAPAGLDTEAENELNQVVYWKKWGSQDEAMAALSKAGEDTYFTDSGLSANTPYVYSCQAVYGSTTLNGTTNVTVTTPASS